MRGTPVPQRLHDAREGIIPAYAGNTPSSARSCRASGDHPRVCGEHAGISVIGTDGSGSSPRMRGTRGAKTRAACVNGIIPAYAGNTTIRTALKFGDRDHPRVCGEHTQIQSISLVQKGSSPRMRGTPAAPVRIAPCFGIIPAYAGNTANVF